jgi:hypothetical protein
MEYEMKPKYFKSKKVKILDSKEFKFGKIDGIKITELSDLAYHDGILYGVSDQGFFYKFALDIKNKKIQDIKPLKGMKLKNKRGKTLKRSKRDAEGLCYVDGKFLISFERRPRVEYFNHHAKKIKKAKIGKKLLNLDNYISKNKALEAVTYSKKYGVVTAPELPLKKRKKSKHTIYTKIKNFKFNAAGSITAFEFIDDDKILVLMREYSFFKRYLKITLLSVDFSNGDVDILLKMDSQKGWNVDNFEGLTKVGDNLYLMVSDDNESMFQKTLFVLFELKIPLK